MPAEGVGHAVVAEDVVGLGNGCLAGIRLIGILGRAGREQKSRNKKVEAPHDGASSRCVPRRERARASAIRRVRAALAAAVEQPPEERFDGREERAWIGREGRAFERDVLDGVNVDAREHASHRA